MARPSEFRFSIRSIGALIGSVALVLAVLTVRGEGGVLFAVSGGIVLLLLMYLGFQALIDSTGGLACPRCGAPGLTRSAVLSFGYRYFHCRQCRRRFRRMLVFDWEDAGTASFDRFFKKARPENPWTAFPGLDDPDDMIGCPKTTAFLLRNKEVRAETSLKSRRGPPDGQSSSFSRDSSS